MAMKLLLAAVLFVSVGFVPGEGGDSSELVQTRLAATQEDDYQRDYYDSGVYHVSIGANHGFDVAGSFGVEHDRRAARSADSDPSYQAPRARDGDPQAALAAKKKRGGRQREYEERMGLAKAKSGKGRTDETAEAKEDKILLGEDRWQNLHHDRANVEGAARAKIGEKKTRKTAEAQGERFLLGEEESSLVRHHANEKEAEWTQSQSDSDYYYSQVQSNSGKSTPAKAMYSVDLQHLNFNRLTQSVDLMLGVGRVIKRLLASAFEVEYCNIEVSLSGTGQAVEGQVVIVGVQPTTEGPQCGSAMCGSEISSYIRRIPGIENAMNTKRIDTSIKAVTGGTDDIWSDGDGDADGGDDGDGYYYYGEPTSCKRPINCKGIQATGAGTQLGKSTNVMCSGAPSLSGAQKLPSASTLMCNKDGQWDTCPTCPK